MTNDTEFDNPNYADGMPSRVKTYAVSTAGALIGIGITVGVGWTLNKLATRKAKKTQTEN